MKEQLQSYIYVEKLLCDLYKKVATLTSLSDEKGMFLDFSKSCHEAVGCLKYFYKEQFGSEFDPMIPEINIQGTYREVLNHIQQQELESFLNYRRHTYFQDNYLLQETMRGIADSKLEHIIAIMAIVINMNDPQKTINNKHNLE